MQLPLDRPAGPDGDVTLGVRPGAVRLAALGLPAQVELLENLGDTTIVDLDAGDRRVKMRSEGRPDLREGDNVHLAFAPQAIHLFDATAGDRR